MKLWTPLQFTKAFGGQSHTGTADGPNQQLLFYHTLDNNTLIIGTVHTLESPPFDSPEPEFRRSLDSQIKTILSLLLQEGK